MIRARSLSLVAGAAIAVLLGGCNEVPENTAQGYVEGNFLTLAAQHPGRLVDVAASEGDWVAAGSALFAVDATVAAAALSTAQARHRQAEQELQDLLVGARPQELHILESGVERALADLELARARLERQRSLFERSVTARDSLDEAQAAFANAEARVAEAREQLDLARLPERQNRVEAARAAVDAAAAEVRRNQALIAEHRGAAPADGVIQEVLRRQGEVVGAGLAVMLFLPDDGRRAVFFVAQDRLPLIQRGVAVAISCDNCPDGLTAPITYIDREVQFTPPVIYGPAQRDRLVIRVEAAIPAEFAPRLHPGQPITVTLPVGG